MKRVLCDGFIASLLKNMEVISGLMHIMTLYLHYIHFHIA